MNICVGELRILHVTAACPLNVVRLSGYDIIFGYLLEANLQLFALQCCLIQTVECGICQWAGIYFLLCQ